MRSMVQAVRNQCKAANRNACVVEAVTDALESGRRRRPAKISGYLGFMSVQIRIRRIKSQLD